jgi:hypothetical protein
VAGLQIGRDPGLNRDGGQLRVADVPGFHLEAPRLEMFDPGAAAPSRR